MKKYLVGVDYTASVYFKVKASSHKEAARKGLRKAVAVVPYEQLAVIVNNVEEIGEEDWGDNDDEEEQNDAIHTR